MLYRIISITFVRIRWIHLRNARFVVGLRYDVCALVPWQVHRHPKTVHHKFAHAKLIHARVFVCDLITPHNQRRHERGESVCVNIFTLNGMNPYG